MYMYIQLRTIKLGLPDLASIEDAQLKLNLKENIRWHIYSYIYFDKFTFDLNSLFGCMNHFELIFVYHMK